MGFANRFAFYMARWLAMMESIFSPIHHPGQHSDTGVYTDACGKVIQRQMVQGYTHHLPYFYGLTFIHYRYPFAITGCTAGLVGSLERTQTFPLSHWFTLLSKCGVEILLPIHVYVTRSQSLFQTILKCRKFTYYVQ